MRVKLKEIRKLMGKESERLELPLELEQSPEAYDRIKSKLIDDEVIHLTPWPSILPPQWNLDEQFPTPCDCRPCIHSVNKYGFYYTQE